MTSPLTSDLQHAAGLRRASLIAVAFSIPAEAETGAASSSPPAAPKTRGVVRWYAADKGYGFLSSGPGADVFVFQDDVTDHDARGPLTEGEAVTFTVSMYRGKPKALDVERDAPVPAVTVAPPAPPAPPAAQRRVGRVRWFDVARKYGFIVPLDGAPDVFLHLRDLEPGVAEALEELAVVSYDVVPYRDKTKAVRLQIVDAAAYAQLVLEIVPPQAHRHFSPNPHPHPSPDPSPLTPRSCPRRGAPRPLCTSRATPRPRPGVRPRVR